MTATLTPVPKIQFFADDGTPLVGGKLYSYAAGTTTPLATYTTYAGTVANTNPVILDSRGEANVWLTSGVLYKLALYDADNALIWTVDNVNNDVFTTLLVSQPNATATDVGTLRVSRIANYSGGTPGFVNSAIRADTAVSAGATAFEWAITGVMDNYATAGENVGGYFQGLRRSTGSTWGAVTEVIDYSGGDPTMGAVSLEVDVSANGTDATNNRLGIDIVVRKQVSSGAACVAGFGIRMQNVSDATSGFTVGIDLSQCTYFQAAIRLAQTQPIAFNATASRQLSHNGSEFLFRNPTGPVNYWKLKDDFTLLANDVQLIGTRKTGWSVATNGSKAALNGSTATLAQTSAAVAQLIIDLTAHGLIGA
jgi:hypothetical protein